MNVKRLNSQFDVSVQKLVPDLNFSNIAHLIKNKTSYSKTCKSVTATSLAR